MDRNNMGPPNNMNAMVQMMQGMGAMMQMMQGMGHSGGAPNLTMILPSSTPALADVETRAAGVEAASPAKAPSSGSMSCSTSPPSSAVASASSGTTSIAPFDMFAALGVERRPSSDALDGEESCIATAQPTGVSAKAKGRGRKRAAPKGASNPMGRSGPFRVLLNIETFLSECQKVLGDWQCSSKFDCTAEFYNDIDKKRAEASDRSDAITERVNNGLVDSRTDGLISGCDKMAVALEAIVHSQSVWSDHLTKPDGDKTFARISAVNDALLQNEALAPLWRGGFWRPLWQVELTHLLKVTYAIRCNAGPVDLNNILLTISNDQLKLLWPAEVISRYPDEHPAFTPTARQLPEQLKSHWTFEKGYVRVWSHTLSKLNAAIKPAELRHTIGKLFSPNFPELASLHQSEVVADVRDDAAGRRDVQVAPAEADDDFGDVDFDAFNDDLPNEALSVARRTNSHPTRSERWPKTSCP